MTDDDGIQTCLDSLTGLGEEALGEIEVLYPAVYEDLRRLAQNRMKREPGADVLQPTALVNEVYLKLAEQRDARINSRTHFIAIASVAMQRILCDSARSRKAAKRGGGWNLSLIHI